MNFSLLYSIKEKLVNYRENSRVHAKTLPFPHYFFSPKRVNCKTLKALSLPSSFLKFSHKLKWETTKVRTNRSSTLNPCSPFFCLRFTKRLGTKPSFEISLANILEVWATLNLTQLHHVSTYMSLWSLRPVRPIKSDAFYIHYCVILDVLLSTDIIIFYRLANIKCDKNQM